MGFFLGSYNRRLTLQAPDPRLSILELVKIRQP